VEDVPPGLRTPVAVVPPAADRWPHGPTEGLRPGDWARYREAGLTLTYAAVEREEDALWIETILEGEVRQASAALVGTDGVVRKAFYGEVSKEGKSAVSPQPVVQTSGAPARRWTELSREGGEERIAVGGRALACRSQRVRYEDLEGRLFEEHSLWHPEVPPIRAGSEAGGLVRRKSPKVDLELLDFGKDAKPVVERPR